MISGDFDMNTLSVQMHLREMRAFADAERRARQVYRPRQLRRRVGQMLIQAGASLGR